MAGAKLPVTLDGVATLRANYSAAFGTDFAAAGIGGGVLEVSGLRASQGELTHQIDVAEVIYFHADEKYTVVRTREGEHLIRTPIQELVAQLDAEQFWQVHRSTVINLAHLAGTRRDEASRLFVRFKGLPIELPVSRAYVPRFRAM
jgi:DNA-binding LytR/AlgR family response regulator